MANESATRSQPSALSLLLRPSSAGVSTDVLLPWHFAVAPGARRTQYLECHQLGSSPALGSSVSAMGRGGSSALFRGFDFSLLTCLGHLGLGRRRYGVDQVNGDELDHLSGLLR